MGGTHDRIRGIKGSFKAMEDSLSLLKKLYPQIRLSLNFTLTTENYTELEEAYDYARRQRLAFSAQFAIPWKGAKQFIWNEKQLSAAKEAIYRILEKMATEYRRQKIRMLLDRSTGRHLYKNFLSALFYWRGLIEYQEHPSRRFKRCIAGYRFIQISPSGNLYFCPLLKDRPVGNIRDTAYDFDKIWLSSSAQQLREFIGGGSCHCWLNCTVYPNLEEVLNKSSGAPANKILRIVLLKALKRMRIL
jgi:MoaA/NifB/PqqE/SkfB family radical SAM enzyme